MDPPRSTKGIVVFGGGTATNSLVDVFEELRRSRACTLSYIIPISDNGGSSSELIRVFGGPGIGDVRSRLVRLIPDSETAMKELFNHRLSADAAAARAEWLDIVEGRHALWAPVAGERRELVRSILNHVNMEIVKRARPSSVFNFAKASIGNLFLTGARVFTGSLESAIYLLSTICAVPAAVATLPAINTNFTHHICAGLADGTHITGQNAISHPSAPTALPDVTAAADADAAAGIFFGSGGHAASAAAATLRETAAHDLIEDATLPGSLPSLRKPYLDVHKDHHRHAGPPSSSSPYPPSSRPPSPQPPPAATSAPPTPTRSSGPAPAATDDLPARIRRVWYINPYGHEIWPACSARVASAVRGAGAVVYSVGSLYTSLVPSLVLRGVGAALADDTSTTTTTTSNSTSNSTSGSSGSGGSSNRRYHRPKVLVLNPCLDRETGPVATDPMTAADFVRAVARAAAESEGLLPLPLLLRQRHKREAAAAGEQQHHDDDTDTDTADAHDEDEGEKKKKKERKRAEGEEEKEEEDDDELAVRRYVTHLVYLEGEGAPRVDRDELAGLGVDAVRVYGRRVDGMLRYDEAALAGALGAIIGKSEMVRSRRNTSGQ
ncbi:UPF0052-domain-containing protein [Xylariaceae sp. FL0804]|nr:UPF0052-domain-containing protein [Xylariaceae sp. FL0804]